MTLLDAPLPRTSEKAADLRPADRRRADRDRARRTAERDARRARRRSADDRRTAERGGTAKRSGTAERSRTVRRGGPSTTRPTTRTARARAAAAAPQRQPRAVRQRVGTSVFVALMGALLLVGLLVMLLVNTSLAQGAFRVSELSRQAAELSQQEQQLAGALAAEANPARLEQRARALGMVPQDVPAFLRLSDGTILGTPTPQRAPEIVPVLPVPGTGDPVGTGMSSQADQALGTGTSGTGLLADRAGTEPTADADSTAGAPTAADADSTAGTLVPPGGADPSRSTWMPWTEQGVAP